MHGFLWPLLKVNRWFITDDVVSLIDEPIFNSNTHPAKKTQYFLNQYSEIAQVMSGQTSSGQADLGISKFLPQLSFSDTRLEEMVNKLREQLEAVNETTKRQIEDLKRQNEDILSKLNSEYNG